MRQRGQLRRRITAIVALSAVVLTATGCARGEKGDYSYDSIDVALIVTGFEGTVLSIDLYRGRDHPRGTFLYTVLIEEILYQRKERTWLVSTGDRAYIQHAPGDTLVFLTSEPRLRPGGRYVILTGHGTQERLADGSIREAIFAAYDAESLERVVEPFLGTDPELRVLTADPETATIPEIKAALGAFLHEADAYREAQRRRIADPVIGEHLARALAARGEHPG